MAHKQAVEPESTTSTLADRGRAVVDRLPEVAGSARGAIEEAQARVDGLSDRGVAAASGFALGISGGLLLAGASRLVFALSAIPVILVLRSALTRRSRPA